MAVMLGLGDVHCLVSVESDLIKKIVPELWNGWVSGRVFAVVDGSELGYF